jgi:hypothetical protein
MRNLSHTRIATFLVLMQIYQKIKIFQFVKNSLKNKEEKK